MYQAIGRVAPQLHTPTPSATTTPEQRAVAARGARAMVVCAQAAKDGFVLHDGRPAVVGTQEFTGCSFHVDQLLSQGMSEQQAYESITTAGYAPAAAQTNWLLWGGIGAAVLVGGAYLLTR